MIKYGRIINQYRYEMQKRPGDSLWPRDGNLGDCMQSLGVENIYQKAGVDIDNLTLVNRDDIKEYDGEACHLVMQSWFGDYANTFPLPWSDRISPIFIGFHLNTINKTRERFIREKIYEKMIPFQPIGCRDRDTRDFLKSLGLDAYFSGCMTLTFDKRLTSPASGEGKVFIVDLDEKVSRHLPDRIKNIGDYSISHFYYWNNYPVSEKGAMEFEQYARHVLERYRLEAKLVITSKIHVAMPCVAMGIPVVFITDEPNNMRFDVIQGILPVYSYKDMNYVNWSPEPVNIDYIKKAIINNAVARIKGEDITDTRKELERALDLKPILVAPVYIRLYRYLSSLKKRIKKAIHS